MRPINHPVMMSLARMMPLFEELLSNTKRKFLVKSARDHRDKIEHQGKVLARIAMQGRCSEQEFTMIHAARKRNIDRLALITKRLETNM